MTFSSRDMLQAYCEDTLDAAGMEQLSAWIAASPENAREFATLAMLHDRLADHFQATEQVEPSIRIEPKPAERLPQASALPGDRGRHRLVRLGGALLTAAAAVTMIVFLFLRGLGDSPAAASASAELNRVIAASSSGAERTYLITVEEVALSTTRQLPPDAPEWNRPPKPPLTDATLHVGPAGRFVLVRKTPEGQTVINGSNGNESWALRRPGKSVKVSSDLQHFSRDLPGHEHALSLVSLDEALRQLREAYDVQLLPVEADRAAGREPSRLLVCIRKPGQRGPNRVEISYAVQTGQLLQLRFVEMPYGPERLTLRLTLQDTQAHGNAFFEHTAHHTDDRFIERE